MVGARRLSCHAAAYEASWLKVAPALPDDNASWPTPAHTEGMARPCAARSAARTGWGPRGTPGTPPEPVLNMVVLALSTRYEARHEDFGVSQLIKIERILLQVFE